MKLSAGIVGLPNVGKSTLFNAITNLNVEAANYPFATIEPNVGIVKLNDERLTKLTNLIKPKKTTYATCTFVDIAGLVKGASNGEGLGNKFLSNIREVDAICHVVRCFNDSGITHVFNTVDPIRDAEIINLELIYSDLDILEKRLSKIAQTAKSGNTLAAFEESILKRLINSLKESNFINTNNFSVEENKIITNYNLITAKPFLYIANLNDDDISSPEANNNFKLFSEWVKKQSNAYIVPISVNMEFEISKLNDEEKQVFLDDLGVKESGIDKLTKKTYEILNLSTYFTFGADETKAWTFVNGMSAPKCAGLIHTDFEKGFIRAEVINWNDILVYGSELKAKENGKMRSEGKEYLMKDGDVVLFRFNK